MSASSAPAGSPSGSTSPLPGPSSSSSSNRYNLSPAEVQRLKVRLQTPSKRLMAFETVPRVGG
jgi:hypothetical protein